MKLRDWMVENGVSRRDLAKALGVCINTIDRWNNRTRRPSYPSIIRLHEFTGGEVTDTDFIEKRSG